MRQSEHAAHCQVLLYNCSRACRHVPGGLYLDQVGEALARWREDVVMEPDSYIILKQVWAVRNPEKFYDGDVNYDWQREPTGKEPKPTQRPAHGPA